MDTELAESTLPAVENEITTLRQKAFLEVQQAKQRADAILVHDQHSYELALVFQTEMRGLADKLEQLRDTEVRPLNTKVKAINDDYRPYGKLCEAIDERLGAQVKNYRDQQRRELEQRQRKEIEEANRRKAEEAQKAEHFWKAAEDAKRQEAEEAKAVQEKQRLDDALALIEQEKARARAADDQDTLSVIEKREAAIQAERATLPETTVTETREALQQALLALQGEKAIARAHMDEDALAVIDAKERRLSEQLGQLSGELTSVDLESKAQEAELTAASIAPRVVEQVQKTVSLPTGVKVGFTPTKVPVCLPGGLPVDGVYYRNDGRLKVLPDDLFLLDTKRLRKRVKEGQEIPGVEVKDEEISRRR